MKVYKHTGLHNKTDQLTMVHKFYTNWNTNYDHSDDYELIKLSLPMDTGE